MGNDDLIEAITAEIERIWPEEEGFEGTSEQYDWLLAHYGITAEEDNRWLDILVHSWGEEIEDLEPEDKADLMVFLEDEVAVGVFLNHLLAKYRASDAVYQS